MTAAEKYVLCGALCFLVNRFGKCAAKVLKDTVLDYYSIDELVKAKKQLLDDVCKLNLSVNAPHVPDRRDCEGRGARVVEDIFVILAFLDEQLVLKTLPKYVVDSPDSMPSARLFEGDFQTLTKFLEKLNARMEECGSSVGAILKELLSLKDQVQALSTARPSSCDWPPLPSRSDRPAFHSQQSRAQPSAAINNQSASLQRNDVTSQVCPRDQLFQSTCENGASAANWADNTSTPIASSNRFAALQHTDDDDSSDGQSQYPFTTYESRRSAKRRRRQESAQQEQRQRLQQQQQAEQRKEPPAQRSRRLLVGKAAQPASAIVRGVPPARKVLPVKKSVFCIDNVSTDVEVDDLRNFVASLSVTVFSCFKTLPRRRQGEFDRVTDRHAFRLCIPESDCDKLLVDSKWPEAVTISEWYFIPPAEAAERRRRAEERADERRSDIRNTQPPVSVPRWTDSEQTTAQTSAANDVDSEDLNPADQRTEAEVAMEDENIETPEKTVLYHHGDSKAV